MGGIAIPSAIFYNRDSCMRAAVCNAGSGWQCPVVFGI